MPDYETFLVYLGQMEGTFSLNSRAMPGHKYRVARGQPFGIPDGDLWIASMQGYRVLSLVDFVPTVRRLILADTTYLSRAEAAFLEGLAATCPDPARVVELGTGKGQSLARLLYGLNLHYDAHVWSYDLNECKDGRAYVQDAWIPNWRYSLVIGDSVAAAATFPEPVDLIYIDANHSYDGVKRDIEAWMPQVKQNGIMALHDYGNPKHEVSAAIDELLFTREDDWRHLGQAGTLVAFERLW